MNFKNYLFSAAAFILFIPAVLWGQSGAHDFVIEPPTASGQYMNTSISGDTLANGQRVDPLREYVLRRGGMYLVNAFIRNTGYKLVIKAEPGTGPKPIVYLFPNPTTQLPPGQFISMGGDLKLKNLAVSGYFEPGDTAYLGGLQGALINTNAIGLNLDIDSCILSNTNGNHVRTDNAPKRVSITNTIFANMGYLGRSNLGAGKAIDVRGGSVDSLLVVNNTFVNAQDRIIRHYGSTAPIKYLLFDHNTIVNSMSYHGVLSLGKVGYKSVITNNLFVDAFALGNDTDYVRQAEFTDSGEKDPYGGARMNWIISSPNDTTVWTIKNNYYSVSASGQAFYDANKTAGVTGEGSPLTWHISRKVGADSANAFKKLATPVTLTNVPKLMTAMMNWYRLPAASGGAGKTKNTGNFKIIYDYDRHLIGYYHDTMKCNYSTSLPIYTAAETFPVGDLNWFPDRKAAWLNTTDVEENESMPVSFNLKQNYPNPFNPSTSIAYSVVKESKVKLEVFDVLGRKVATLVNGNQIAGSYKVNFDASKLSSGVYIYTLTSQDQSLSKKMMLIK